MVFGWSGMGRIKFDDDTCPPGSLGPADGSCKGARRHQKVDVCRRESSSVAFGAPSGMHWGNAYRISGPADPSCGLSGVRRTVTNLADCHVPGFRRGGGTPRAELLVGGVQL